MSRLDEELRRRPGRADREATDQDRYYDGASYLGADSFPPWTDDSDDHEAELR